MKTRIPIWCGAAWLAALFLQSVLAQPPAAEVPAPAAEPVAVTPAAAVAAPAAVAPAAEAAEPVPAPPADGILRVTINVEDTLVSQILNAFSKQTGRSIVIGPDIVGRTTARLNNVPWDEALDAVLKPFNYGHYEQGNATVVCGVDPVQTQVFTIKHLDASDVEETIQGFLSPRGKMTRVTSRGQSWGASQTLGERTVAGGETLGRRKREQEPKEIARSKNLVVTDEPMILNRIERFLKTVDVAPALILIEAQFLEVNPRMLQDLGLEFTSAGGIASGSEAYAYDMATKTYAASPGNFASGFGQTLNATAPFNAGLNLVFQKLTPTQFEVLLHMLQADESSKTLSAPRILTLNNREASIMIGTKYPIINSDASDSGGSSATITTSLEGYEDIGIQLNVLPQICDDNLINMMVRPSVRELIGQKSGKTVSGETTALTDYPVISTREAETQVILQHGQTIVIGGLLKDEEKKVVLKVPFIGNIPLLGWLFRRETTKTEKVDLLIFLTASIVPAEGSNLTLTNVASVASATVADEREATQAALDKAEKKKALAAQKAAAQAEAAAIAQKQDEERKALEAAAAEQAAEEKVRREKAQAEAQAQKLAAEKKAAAVAAKQQALAEKQKAKEARAAASAQQKAAQQKARAAALAEKAAAEQAQQEAALAAEKKAAAEKKSLEEAKLKNLAEQQAAAEKQAADEAKQKALADKQAAEEARVAALAKQQAAEEKARQAAALAAEKQAAAEKKAADEAKQKALAEKQAAEEARVAALAKQQAAEEKARQAAALAAEKQAAAEKKAADEAKQKALAEKQAAEEARVAALAKQQAAEEKARQDAVLAAEKQAAAEKKAADKAKQKALDEKQAAEEARVAALAKQKAEEQKAREAVLAQKAAEQKAREEAALAKVEAKQAAREARLAEIARQRADEQKAREAILAQKIAAKEARIAADLAASEELARQRAAQRVAAEEAKRLAIAERAAAQEARAAAQLAAEESKRLAEAEKIAAAEARRAEKARLNFEAQQAREAAAAQEADAIKARRDLARSAAEAKTVAADELTRQLKAEPVVVGNPQPPSGLLRMDDSGSTEGIQ